MTPRESARQHLPELDANFAALQTTFGAKIMHLQTPDGSWGRPLAFLDWPMVRGDEIAAASWQPGVSRGAARA